MNGPTTPTAHRWKWPRRIVHGFAYIIGVIVILAAILPTLLLNGPVEKRISVIAGEFLGRPVIISDLAFGWRTPLRIGRISLPAVDGEQGYPLVEIRNVSSPLTLAKIAALPPYSVVVDVEHIEFNLVKVSTNETSVSRILARFPKGSRDEPVARTKPAGVVRPTLPLKNLSIKLVQIDVRYVDATTNLVAGLQSGSLFAGWSGNTNPLTITLAGDVRLNATNFPLLLNANLESWVDRSGKLTIDSAHLAVDSGGGRKSAILINGYAGAGIRSIVHVQLPLGMVLKAARALPMVPPLPEIAGELGFDLSATHTGNFKNWDIESNVVFKNIKATGIANTETNRSPVRQKAFIGTLAIDGSLAFNGKIALPHESNGSDSQHASKLRIDGVLATEVKTLDVNAGQLGVSLADFFDNRKFKAVMDQNPVQFTYSDEASTGFSAIEGTVGVLVGKTRLDTRAKFISTGKVTYDISRASVGGIVFSAKNIDLNIPPISISGLLSADLNDKVASSTDLHCAIENCLTASVSPLFRWEEGEFHVNAGLSLHSISNLLAIAHFKGPGAPVLPRVSGGADFTANFTGRIPTNGFDITCPLPLSGDLKIRITDVAVDGGPKYVVKGINADAALTISPDGRDVDFDAKLSMDNVESGQRMALKGIHLDVTTALHSFDRLDASLKSMSIDSLGTSGSGRVAVGGLIAVLNAKGKSMDPVKVLRALSVDLDGAFTQQLKDLSSIVPQLDCDGQVGISLAFKNMPGQELGGILNLDVKKARIKFDDKALIDGLDGSWTITKSFRMQNEGRRLAVQPAGTIGMKSLTITTPRLPIEIRNAGLRFSGIDDGIKIDFTAADLVGGPAEASCSLAIHNGNPELNGKLTLTGLNGEALLPGTAFRNRSEADINAVADISLFLPDEPRGSILSNLRLRVRTMRIGKSALVRILEAMDSRQETPQFQNALVALSIGTPVGAELILANALVTINVDLLLTGGIRVPLPILDSAPLSDILGVYKLDEASRKLDLVRWALLLLLTDDLGQLEKHIADMPK